MAEAVRLDHVALQAGGPTISLGVESGQSLVVMGPSGSGKSYLLGILSGRERPPRGSAKITETVSFASQGSHGRRARPQGLARRHRGTDRAATVLSALGLWEVRQTPLSDLSPGQLAAAELIDPLTGDAELVVIDGTLDQLDPWTFSGAVRLLHERNQEGAAVVIASNRPDLVHSFDLLVVLKKGRVAFAGSVDELLRNGPPQDVEVRTDRAAAVRALVDPFKISVREIDGGVVFQAQEGQSIVAKLLMEGYGDVEYAIVYRKGVEDALLAL